MRCRPVFPNQTTQLFQEGSSIMKFSTPVRLLFLFSAILLAWPLSSLMAARTQQSNPITAQPPSPPGDQAGGSVLIYNYYNSNSSQKDTDTEISLTNTHSSLTATAHVFFVRQSNCGVT